MGELAIRNGPQRPSNAPGCDLGHLIKAIFFHSALKVCDGFRAIYIAKSSEFIWNKKRPQRAFFLCFHLVDGIFGDLLRKSSL